MGKGFRFQRPKYLCMLREWSTGEREERVRGTEARDKGRRWAWSTGGRSRLKGDGRALQLRQRQRRAGTGAPCQHNLIQQPRRLKRLGKTEPPSFPNLVPRAFFFPQLPFTCQHVERPQLNLHGPIRSLASGWVHISRVLARVQGNRRRVVPGPGDQVAPG